MTIPGKRYGSREAAESSSDNDNAKLDRLSLVRGIRPRPFEPAEKVQAPSRI